MQMKRTQPLSTLPNRLRASGFPSFSRLPARDAYPCGIRIVGRACIIRRREFKLPCPYEVIGNDRGHEVVARDVNNREIKIPVYAQISKDIIEVCRQKIHYPEPHKLSWGVVTGSDNRLTIKYSANVRVALPYVFHYFTITTTAEDE